jgi:hypothetical protein
MALAKTMAVKWAVKEANAAQRTNAGPRTAAIGISPAQEMSCNRRHARLLASARRYRCLITPYSQS